MLDPLAQMSGGDSGMGVNLLGPAIDVSARALLLQGGRGGADGSTAHMVMMEKMMIMMMMMLKGDRDYEDDENKIL